MTAAVKESTSVIAPEDTVMFMQTGVMIVPAMNISGAEIYSPGCLGKTGAGKNRTE